MSWTSSLPSESTSRRWLQAPTPLRAWRASCKAMSGAAYPRLQPRGGHRDIAGEQRRAHATTHGYGVAALHLEQSRALLDKARTQLGRAALFVRCWSRWKRIVAPPVPGLVDARDFWRVARAVRSFPNARARDEIYRARDPAHADWSSLARYFRLETGARPWPPRTQTGWRLITCASLWFAT